MKDKLSLLQQQKITTIITKYGWNSEDVLLIPSLQAKHPTKHLER